MNYKEKLTHPIFNVIKSAAKEINAEAYVIGGWVRDIILNRPCKDIDILCVGSGIELANCVSDKLGDSYKVTVFKSFGTAQIVYDDYCIEFVGARKESYRSESRKPIVENGTFDDDINRRDFTINTLAISLGHDNYGDLIDHLNGLADLNNKIIKTPLNPDNTYSDDPLRMMRAIRFASQLQYTIQAESLKSIKSNAKRIDIISRERITDELNKIVLSPTPSVGFKLLYDTGLLSVIFPELSKLQGIEVRDGKGHKDNFYHTLEVLDNISKHTNNLWLRWAAILHDIAKPATKRFNTKQGWTFHGHEDKGSRMVPKIFARLKLPLNDKMKYVQKLVLLHLRPIALAKEEVKDSAVRRLLFEAGEDIDDLMTLCDADITSKNEYKVKKYKNNFELVRTKLKDIEEKDSIRNFQPPISGEMIMKAFNLPACREVGMIKNAIREAILDGHIENNYDQAYQFMINKASELGLELN